MAARLLLTYAGLSLAAVATGAAVCAVSDVPTALWARNLAAWLIGALAAAGLAAAYRPAFLPVALIAAPIGLAATFAFPDQQGVHRWIDAGPLHVNAAMLLLPAATVAFAALAAQGRRWPFAVAAAALALLVLQSDASQATALAAALVVVAFAARRGLKSRLAAAVGAAALAAAAWLRPDPLAPVPEVEGIVALAATVSPLAAGASLLFLFAAALSPALVARREGPSPARTAALALSVLFLVWAAAPFLGAFPVPLVGVGLSPILGAWLGVGLLAGVLKGPPPHPRLP
jgi:hypothetical protein